MGVSERISETIRRTVRADSVREKAHADHASQMVARLLIGSTPRPVPLPLLSQYHSTGRSSPKRYDKRYEDRFLSRVEPIPRRLTCQRDKRCMLASLKPGADFSRGCADETIGHSILKTHPRRIANRVPPAPGAAKTNRAYDN